MALDVNIEKNFPSFNLKANFKQDNGILGFLGASGSGKSMTLRCIAGLDKPSSGKIVVNNTEYYNRSSKLNLAPQKRKVGFLFQNYALFPNMSISENIQIGLGKMDKQLKSKLCNKYIERLGLGGLEKQYPWQLSGGQQQRVALARALITEPDVLLLDEPFSALDHHLRYSMEKELMKILKDYHGNVIFVTHDIEEAYRVCDNIIVFDNGTASENRNKTQLFKAPKSLAEAKITGCKNLSETKVISKNKIYAKGFGYEYTINSPLSRVSYMGIRAHDIKLCNDSHSENCFPYYVENIIENPFNYTIYIKNPNISDSQSINFYLDKNHLDFSIYDIIHIKFPKEKIFVF